MSDTLGPLVDLAESVVSRCALRASWAPTAEERTHLMLDFIKYVIAKHMEHAAKGGIQAIRVEWPEFKT